MTQGQDTKNTPKILSLDPGGTTGYTIHRVRSRGSGAYQYEGTWKGGHLGPDPHHKELWNLLASEAPDRIVCEAFNYQIRRNQRVDMPGISLISRNYIGIVELYCVLTQTELFMQQPSILQNKWLSDKALKKLKVYKPSMPHQNDSARHMIYHIVQTMKRSDCLELLKERQTK